MILKKSIAALLLCLCSSCDPIYRLTVQNETGRKNFIEVVELKFKEVSTLRDSIAIYNGSSKDNFWFPRNTTVEKDLARNSYSFFLDSGKRALLELGLGSQPVAQQIIVNKTDTISVNRKMKKRRLSFGGEYVVTLGN